MRLFAILLVFLFSARGATNFVTFAWDDPNPPGTVGAFYLNWATNSYFTNGTSQGVVAPTTSLAVPLSIPSRYWFTVQTVGKDGSSAGLSNTNSISTVQPAATAITSINVTPVGVAIAWQPVTNYLDGSALFPGEFVRYQVFKGLSFLSLTNAVTQPSQSVAAIDPSPSSGAVQYVVRASILTTNIFSQSQPTQVAITKLLPAKYLRVQSISLVPFP